MSLKPTLYLVCGVSGSGKSWVCRQVDPSRFAYIPHDRCWEHPHKKPTLGDDPKWEPGATSTHLETLVAESKKTHKPIVTECPFAERELRGKLEDAGIRVIPVFVIEHPLVVAERYHNREGKHLPNAAFTRASTIINRAREWGAVHGTSDEILRYFQEL